MNLKGYWSFLTVGFVFVLVLFQPITARADAGPHGGFAANTDACAGCHRTHSAQGPELLVTNVLALCLGCHDGSGAQTNVVQGTLTSSGKGLRGGGFTTALMDTALSGSAVPTAVTSGHTVDGGLSTLWGNGVITSGPGPNIVLMCTNCHNPHGEITYRSLRKIPSGSGASVHVNVPDQATKIYTVSSPTNRYIDETYGSLGSSITAWCVQCHTRYAAGSGSGHTDSGDGIFAFRHNTLTVPCISCHVSHGTSAAMAPNSGSVSFPDSSFAPNNDARSSLLRGNNRIICYSCHVDANGQISGGNCSGCHGAPPASGAHMAHSSPDTVGYGMTDSYNTSADYVFGCGECHPTDSTFHRNGNVDVQLSSTGAPVGSLKARNDPAAAYAADTCGGVYCHSGAQVSSGPVGQPLFSGTTYILDSHGNFTYDPYVVTTTRAYKATPLWSSGSISTACTDCHAFPLTTSFPDVKAGVGNSHQWIDDYGYGNLHAYNMGYDALSCYTCHYGEINLPNTWVRAGDITTYNPVPIADHAAHVNGQADVAFNTVNTITYNTSSGPVNFSLVGATYNPSEKSCGNVGCHLKQNYVVWGSPYRWWTNECDLCHRYGLPPVPGAPLQLPALSGNSTKIHSQGQSCTACHTVPHGK